MQRKRAQGRAQDIPYQSISPYHHGTWRIFIECGKKPHARKSAQGRSARGPILPKSNRNFRQPPYPKNARRPEGNMFEQRFSYISKSYPGVCRFFSGNHRL